MIKRVESKSEMKPDGQFLCYNKYKVIILINFIITINMYA